MLHRSDVNSLVLLPIPVTIETYKLRIQRWTDTTRSKTYKNAYYNVGGKIIGTYCLSVPEVNISVTKLMFLLAVSTQEV
jgi:hypothetical protein